MEGYYILTEDTGSGYQFYKLVNSCYLNNVYTVISCVELLGKSGNSLMLSALKELIRRIGKYKYIILAYDNQLILSTDKNNYAFNLRKDLFEFIESMNSLYLDSKIVLLDYICFEYLLLDLRLDLVFKSLPDAYTFLYDKILNLYTIEDKEFACEEIIKEYKKLYNVKNITIEQVLAHVLNVITHIGKNSNFVINKSALGRCWCCDCFQVSKKFCYFHECTVKESLSTIYDLGSDCDLNSWVNRNRYLLEKRNSCLYSLVLSLRRFVHA